MEALQIKKRYWDLRDRRDASDITFWELTGPYYAYLRSLRLFSEVELGILDAITPIDEDEYNTLVARLPTEAWYRRRSFHAICQRRQADYQELYTLSDQLNKFGPRYWTR